MKKVCFKSMVLMMAAALTFSMTSCSNDDDENPNEDPWRKEMGVDKSFAYRFHFNAKGVPYVKPDTLKAAKQEALMNEIVGRGWKCKWSRRIYGDGYVSKKDFYDGLLGTAPIQYFFTSANEMTQYVYLDYLPANVYINCNTLIDKVSGRINCDKSTEILQFINMEKVQGIWQFTVILHLGKDNQGDVWGVSCYEEMTPEQMKYIQTRYTNIDDLNLKW